MVEGRTKTYTAITTAAGALEKMAATSHPYATYAIQVKGVAGAASSWSVTLEGSLDGVNYTTIATHNATDGSTVWETTGKPTLFVRPNVGALTLGGSATSITVIVVAVP